MIQNFADKEAEAFWITGKSRKIPPALHRRALDRLQALDAATKVEQLRFPPSNNLEKLGGDRKGFWSLRINKQYRVIFRFETGQAFDVAIIDYH